LGDSQRVLCGEAEEVVDTGAAGLIEEEATWVLAWIACWGQFWNTCP